MKSPIDAVTVLIWIAVLFGPSCCAAIASDDLGELICPHAEGYCSAVIWATPRAGDNRLQIPTPGYSNFRNGQLPRPENLDKLLCDSLPKLHEVGVSKVVYFIVGSAYGSKLLKIVLICQPPDIVRELLSRELTKVLAHPKVQIATGKGSVTVRLLDYPPHPMAEDSAISDWKLQLAEIAKTDPHQGYVNLRPSTIWRVSSSDVSTQFPEGVRDAWSLCESISVFGSNRSDCRVLMGFKKVASAERIIRTLIAEHDCNDLVVEKIAERNMLLIRVSSEETSRQVQHWLDLIQPQPEFIIP